jgi:hypothetical protein
MCRFTHSRGDETHKPRSVYMVKAQTHLGQSDSEWSPQQAIRNRIRARVEHGKRPEIDDEFGGGDTVDEEQYIDGSLQRYRRHRERGCDRQTHNDHPASCHLSVTADSILNYADLEKTASKSSFALADRH